MILIIVSREHKKQLNKLRNLIYNHKMNKYKSLNRKLRRRINKIFKGRNLLKRHNKISKIPLKIKYIKRNCRMSLNHFNKL